jgi:hypothetical protein
MSKLNILVLHWMGDPRSRRETVRALECMIPECRSDVNCIVHDTDLPYPRYLEDIEYDLIVMGPTFLCRRYYRASFAKALNDYNFVKYSKACKIALPQDDYCCSGILDDWMVDWGVDRVYTVCPKYWDVLYPKSSKSIEIKLGYTGYISNDWIDSWVKPKAHNHRSITVSYRALKLPANFGSLGQLKWRIAERFQAQLKNRKETKLDISTDPKDLIPGNAWHEFMEDSKFCLSTPSGSSLLDPWNKISICVNAYTALYPAASFEEIEKHCFSGLDRQFVFTAISPRNIEAALAGTVQIATPGDYSGLMNPLEHFIPLDEDCGNLSNVLEMMADKNLVANIQVKCKESILSEARLRRTIFVDEIISYAETVVTVRGRANQRQEFISRYFHKYNSDIQKIADDFWKRKRVAKKIRAAAAYFGARRLKHLIEPILNKR